MVKAAGCIISEMEVQHIKQFLQGVAVIHNDIKQPVFSALYGVHFLTAAVLYTTVAINQPNITVVHLLWTLHWLKHYPTVQDGAVRWKCDVKTYKKYVWYTLCSLLLSLDSVS